MTCDVINDDCLAALPAMAADSFDAVITDPPYEIGFMGKVWDSSGVAFRPATWRTALRVLKPGGYAAVFGGSRTYHRIACAVEDAGFEIRDCVLWLYGCLSEDTELLTSRGWVRYGRITTDSLALAYDPVTDSFEWEQVQEVMTYDYRDTAYRIQSDHTDQLVSRNHRCLVERGGSYAFEFAEALQQQARVPVLEDVQSLLEALPMRHERAGGAQQDLLAGVRGEGHRGAASAEADGGAWGDGGNSLRRLRQDGVEGACLAEQSEDADLLAPVQRGVSRGGVEEACGQGARGVVASLQGGACPQDDRGEQPLLEGRDHLHQAEGELRRPQVRPVPGGVPANGDEWRLHRGTPARRGASHGPLADECGDGASCESRPAGQPPREPDAFRIQQRPQVVRGSRFARADLARVTPVWHEGVVWCVRVPSGAFVARRNGKVFVTGNSGFPKGKGCLKPAYEPIILARKPGPCVLPLGIDECRIGTETIRSSGAKPGAASFGSAKPDVTGSHIWNGREPAEHQGRYPANALHDGSAEVLEAFAAFGESKSSSRSRRSSAGSMGFGGNSKPFETGGFNDAGTAARFFFCAKASKAERGEGSAHPTVKPLALMRWLVRLACPPGGVVLDPFAGSGSTLVACKLEGRSSVGVELQPHHAATIRRRLKSSGEGEE